MDYQQCHTVLDWIINNDPHQWMMYSDFHEWMIINNQKRANDQKCITRMEDQ